MTQKTPTNGYYELPNGQNLHFSMNTWYNLKEDSGKDLSDFSEALEKGTSVEKAFVIAEVIHAAAKAYNQEEGLPINFNIYKIRGWLGSTVGPAEIEGITKALLWNTQGVGTEGKPTGTQK